MAASPQLQEAAWPAAAARSAPLVLGFQIPIAITLWPSPMSFVVLDDATRLEPGELAEYIRVKLNLAIQLACEAEHERRSGHWESAEGYNCRWEEVMAEVRRLLPVLRNSGVSLFGKSHARNSLRAG